LAFPFENDKTPLEGLPSRAAALLKGAGLETAEDVAEVLVEDGDVLLAIDGIGPKTLEAIREWLAEKLAAGEVEVGTSVKAETENDVKADEREIAITVVGDDGLSGQELAQWSGAARIGLKSLDVEDVQLLVGCENGLVTVMAEWPGSETTLSHPANGRSTKMKVIGRINQQIRARV
jgi:hypothetical protein